MEHYKERIFYNSDAAFRKMLKQAVQASNLTYPISTHSFRKFYANTIYKLHPQDADNLMIVQTMMGHSDIETTKISNSPILPVRWDDFREILSKCWDMAQNGEDKFVGINNLIGFAEKCMV